MYESAIKILNILENNGYKVLRFWNDEVMKNIDGVMEVIFREIEGKR